jgi:hypothetical protein
VENIFWGIGNSGDNASESPQRLRAMPPELEPLHEHLLRLIEKEGNTIWASKAFQIVRAVREFCSKDAAGPTRRNKGSTRLSILMLHLALQGSDKMHSGGDTMFPLLLYASFLYFIIVMCSTGLCVSSMTIKSELKSPCLHFEYLTTKA